MTIIKYYSIDMYSGAIDNMNDALEKLNKVSRWMGYGAIVIMAIAVIIMVTFVGLAIAVAVNPDLFTPYFNDETVTTGMMLAACGAGIIGGALIFIAFYYVHRFSANACKNNTPFTNDNVRYLRIIAILTVVCAVITLNPFMLLVSFLIYFVSLVFKYGTELQKESDETL